MSGWVKFHRKIEEWEWYKDANTFRVFFHLVMKANHKDGKWQGIDVKRGEFITSPDKLAESLKLTRQQIRTSLNKLKSTNEITIKSTNKYSVVTIENYGLYQTNEEEPTNKTTNKSTNEQPTNNQQITTNKNDKNEKNEKSSRFTPPTLSDVSSYCSERNNNVNPQRFIDWNESKGWLVGKSKMKDWKSAVRTWESRDKSNNQTTELDRIAELMKRREQ